MSELTGGSPHSDDGFGSPAPAAPRPQGGGFRGGNGGAGGQRQFADDLHSVTIHAKQRTFYIDLKQSGNGKFFKVSEKSRGGQKTTIMFDAEDLDQFIAAFNEMKTKLVWSPTNQRGLGETRVLFLSCRLDGMQNTEHTFFRICYI